MPALAVGELAAGFEFPMKSLASAVLPGRMGTTAQIWSMAGSLRRRVTSAFKGDGRAVVAGRNRGFPHAGSTAAHERALNSAPRRRPNCATVGQLKPHVGAREPDLARL